MRYLIIFITALLAVSFLFLGCSKKDDDDGNGGGGGGGGTTAFNVVWTQTFGDDGEDYGNCVRETSDGGFIIAAGYGELFNPPRSFTLIKTDASGNLTWQKDFEELGYNEARWVEQTDDGGYIAVGYTTSSPYDWAGYQVLLIKTDANGNETWRKVHGGTLHDQGYCVRQTTDGGYILVGHTRASAMDAYDILLIKTDANGVASWTQTIDGNGQDYGFYVDNVSGGYIIAGKSGANNGDFFLVKTNASGATTWSHNFGNATFSDEARCVLPTADGYIVVGEGGASAGFYFVKTDLNGVELFNLEMTSGDIAEKAFCIDNITGGGYIVVGKTASEPTGAVDMDIKLVKITEI